MDENAKKVLTIAGVAAACGAGLIWMTKREARLDKEKKYEAPGKDDYDEAEFGAIQSGLAAKLIRMGFVGPEPGFRNHTYAIGDHTITVDPIRERTHDTRNGIAHYYELEGVNWKGGKHGGAVTNKFTSKPQSLNNLRMRVDELVEWIKNEITEHEAWVNRRVTDKEFELSADPKMIEFIGPDLPEIGERVTVLGENFIVRKEGRPLPAKEHPGEINHAFYLQKPKGKRAYIAFFRVGKRNGWLSKATSAMFDWEEEVKPTDKEFELSSGDCEFSVDDRVRVKSVPSVGNKDWHNRLIKLREEKTVGTVMKIEERGRAEVKFPWMYNVGMGSIITGIPCLSLEAANEGTDKEFELSANPPTPEAKWSHMSIIDRNEIAEEAGVNKATARKKWTDMEAKERAQLAQILMSWWAFKSPDTPPTPENKWSHMSIIDRNEIVEEAGVDKAAARKKWSDMDAKERVQLAEILMSWWAFKAPDSILDKMKVRWQKEGFTPTQIEELVAVYHKKHPRQSFAYDKGFAEAQRKYYQEKEELERAQTNKEFELGATKYNKNVKELIDAGIGAMWDVITPDPASDYVSVHGLKLQRWRCSHCNLPIKWESGSDDEPGIAYCDIHGGVEPVDVLATNWRKEDAFEIAIYDYVGKHKGETISAKDIGVDKAYFKEWLANPATGANSEGGLISNKDYLANEHFNVTLEV